jgi:2-polyprenyl-3-methyl-5-hydroxy-6-metoxy-1,4-benzoquinol methylase
MKPARSARRVIRAAKSDGPAAATRVLRNGVSWRLRRLRQRRRTLLGAAPVGPSTPSDPGTAERLELHTDRRIEGNVELVERIRASLIEHHFCKLTGWSEEGGRERFKVDLDRHSYMRHDAAATYIVPWVNQVFPLAGATVVEIGCGTGSSTAAFAPFVEHIFGYDISDSSIAAANVRLDAHGLSDNATLVALPPDSLLDSIERNHADEPVDVVLLFAVLEHQTIEERITTLRLAERLLRPGGVIVITETPNRLTYVDRHTSQLPFFHMLPIDLQLLYADRSPRFGFADNIRIHHTRNRGPEAMRDLMTRWGQSVSFHDFEVAIGDVNDRIVSSGTHPNLMRLRPEKPEEPALRSFLASTDLKIHPGFTRYFLDLIIRTSSG